ncbi:hypothetical protein PPYR_04275 [Photinus pyralis]|uniref:Reverse transcriptase domain-containing protein n=1 Tax=Photinus pyralis TaxID=7054 RepID=A0A5N4AXM3_PHOPY|nr:hypothetical protein PPYR_04275 [Photinus pyralis]
MLSQANCNLSMAKQWSEWNELTINETKTENMVLSLKHLDLPNPDCVKFLGVYLDPKLSFDSHINYISAKLNTNIFVLRKLANKVSQTVLLTSYHALCHSLLSYAILSWGNCSQAKYVFKLQRRAIRIVANVRYRDDCRNTFKTLNILTLPCVYILAGLCHAKSNAHTFITQRDVHSYDTRQTTFLRVPFCRLTKSQNGPHITIYKLFNCLPDKIKQRDFTSYKDKLRKFLIANAFYSVQEFINYSKDNLS